MENKKSFEELMKEQVSRLNKRGEKLLANRLEQLVQDRRTTANAIALRKAVQPK